MPLPRSNTISIGPLGPWFPERSALLTITPLQAKIILENYNTHNRGFRTTIVELVKNCLKTGTWQVNGENIIFGYNKQTETGILLDGQNRLKACVDSGIPLTSWVVFGLDQSVFVSIDRGANRTLSDDLSVHHEKNTTMLAATCKIVIAYHNGIRSQAIVSSPVVSQDDVFSFLDTHPNVRKSVHFTQGNNRKQYPIVGRIISSCHFLFGEKDETLRDEYLDKLASGVDMEAGHPILAVRNRLVQSRILIKGSMRGSNQLITMEGMHALITGWNHFRKGNKISSLVIRASKNDKGEEVLMLPDIV